MLDSHYLLVPKPPRLRLTIIACRPLDPELLEPLDHPVLSFVTGRPLILFNRERLLGVRGDSEAVTK